MKFIYQHPKIKKILTLVVMIFMIGQMLLMPLDYVLAFPLIFPSPMGDNESGEINLFFQDEIKAYKRTIKDRIWSGLVLSAAISLRNATVQISRLAAKEMFDVMRTGGKGKSPLFESRTWEKMGLDAADYATASVMQELRDLAWQYLRIDICNPDPDIAFQLLLPIVKDKQRSAECGWRDLYQNYGNIYRAMEARIKEISRAENPGAALTLYLMNNFVNISMSDKVSGVGMGLKVQDKIKREQAYKLYSESNERMESQGGKSIVDVGGMFNLTPAFMTRGYMMNEQDDLIKGSKDELTASEAVLADIPEAIAGAFLTTLGGEALKWGMLKLIMMGIAKPGNFEIPDLSITFGDFSGDGGQVFIQKPEKIEQDFASIRTVNLSFSTKQVDMMTEFTSCPDPRGVNNCVMEQDFADAVRMADRNQPLTVQGAVDEGYLNPNRQFIGPTDPRHMLDDCYEMGFCYSNMVKLRKARILPVGWEILAKKSTTAEPFSLGDALAGFDDDASPYYKMINPQWVLMAPKAKCNIEGPGQTLLAKGTDERADYCADLMTCIDEKDNGGCDAWGYCAAEKNTFKLGGMECEGIYDSCRKVTSAHGRAYSLLLNTVDYEDCDATNAGCMIYALQKQRTDLAPGQYEWNWNINLADSEHDNVKLSSANFDAEIEKLPCDPLNAGCSEFMRIKPGASANLLPNSSFEYHESSNIFAWDQNGGVGIATSGEIVGTTSSRFGDRVAVFAGSQSMSMDKPAVIAPKPFKRFFVVSGYVYKQYDDSTFNITITSEPTVDSEVLLSNQSDIGSGPPFGNDNATFATLPDGSWHRVYSLVQINPGQNEAHAGKLNVQFTGENVYLDGVMLEELEQPELIFMNEYLEYGGQENSIISLKKAPAYYGCYDTTLGGAEYGIPENNDQIFYAGLATANLCVQDTATEGERKLMTIQSGDEVKNITCRRGQDADCELDLQGYCIGTEFEPRSKCDVNNNGYPDFEEVNCTMNADCQTGGGPVIQEGLCENKYVCANSLTSCTPMNDVSSGFCTVNPDAAACKEARKNAIDEGISEEDYLSEHSYYDCGGWIQECVPKDVCTQGKLFTECSDEGTPEEKNASCNVIEAVQCVQKANVLTEGVCSYDESISCTINAEFPNGYCPNYQASGTCEEFIMDPDSDSGSGLLGVGNDLILQEDPDFTSIEINQALSVQSQCRDFAQICSAQDVGCEAYTPTDGGQTMNGIVSYYDYCPSVCVGYNNYYQSETFFEEAEYPTYMIPSTAEVCGAEEAGCDEFTRLDLAEAGGESREFFTELKPCVRIPENEDQCASFYTWESNEVSGYQLETHYLKQDNGRPATSSMGIIPSECRDYDPDNSIPECFPYYCDAEAFNDKINPDCREFYDEAGTRYYALLSRAVVCSEDCRAFRKTQKYPESLQVSHLSEAECAERNGGWAEPNTCVLSAQNQCEFRGGIYDTGNGECIFMAIPGQGRACSEEAVGCREYKGNFAGDEEFVYSTSFSDNSLDWSEYIDVTLGNDQASQETHIDGQYLNLTDSLNDGMIVFFNNEGSYDLSLLPGNHYKVSFWAKNQGQDIEITPLVLNFNDISDLAGWGYLSAQKLYLTSETNKPKIREDWAYYNYDIQLPDNYSTGINSFVLQFTGSIYLDNFQIKQINDTSYLIKDTWEVPYVCDNRLDESPVAGERLTPYAQVGCREYTDRDFNTHYLKTFSGLCDENKVGCEALIDMKNTKQAVVSEKANSKLAEHGTDDEYVYLVNNNDGRCPANQVGCTAMGKPKLTVSHDADLDAPYLVQGEAEGQGAYTTFYYKILPDTFDSQDISPLCEDNEVGCEAFTTTDTDDAVHYFKEPFDKTCVYKTGPTGNEKGWYKTVTQPGPNNTEVEVPCGIDEVSFSTGQGGADSSDLGGGVGYTLLGGGVGYILAGGYQNIYSESSMFGEDFYNDGNTQPYRNNTQFANYNGWVGLCPAQQDLCTAFVDPTDRAEIDYDKLSEEGTLGKPYYYINDDKLDDDSCTDVSREAGCVLFNDTSVTAEDKSFVSTYNSYYSYFFGRASGNNVSAPLVYPDKYIPYQPVEPAVEEEDYCDDYDYCRKFEECLLEKVPEGAKLDELRVNPDRMVDYCVDYLRELDMDPTSPNKDLYCSQHFREDGEAIEETDQIANMEKNARCTASQLLQGNDTNTILKVVPTRECAEWYTCSKTNMAWSQNENRYVQQCVGIGLCDSLPAGDPTGCNSKVRENAEHSLLAQNAMLTEHAESLHNNYQTRDTSWFGLEYSGYAVPDIYPLHYLDPVDISAQTKYEGPPQCSDGIDNDGDGEVDLNDTDCADSDQMIEGEPESADYRLANSSPLYACTETYYDNCAGSAGSDDGGCSAWNYSVANELFGFRKQDNSTISYETCYNADGLNRAEAKECMETWRRSFAESSAEESDATVPNPRGPREGVLSTSDDLEVRTCEEFCGTNGGTDKDKERCACISGLCVKPYAENGTFVTAPGPACRVYPEDKAPFPPSVMFDENPTFQNVFTTYLGTLEDDELDKKTKDYGCFYKKVNYGQGAVTKHIPVLYADLNVGTPSGVCQNDTSKTCTCDADGEIETASMCTPKKQENCEMCLLIDNSNITRHFGMQGYCVEYDTSININGRAGEHPCLTWYPTEMASGLIDYRNQFEDAGFVWSDYLPASVDQFNICVEAKRWEKRYGYIAHNSGWLDCGAGLNDTWVEYKSGLGMKRAWGSVVGFEGWSNTGNPHEKSSSYNKESSSYNIFGLGDKFEIEFNEEDIKDGHHYDIGNQINEPMGINWWKRRGKNPGDFYTSSEENEKQNFKKYMKNRGLLCDFDDNLMKYLGGDGDKGNAKLFEKAGLGSSDFPHWTSYYSPSSLLYCATYYCYEIGECPEDGIEVENGDTVPCATTKYDKNFGNSRKFMSSEEGERLKKLEIEKCKTGFEVGRISRFEVEESLSRGENKYSLYVRGDLDKRTIPFTHFVYHYECIPKGIKSDSNYAWFKTKNKINDGNIYRGLGLDNYIGTPDYPGSAFWYEPFHDDYLREDENVINHYPEGNDEVNKSIELFEEEELVCSNFINFKNFKNSPVKTNVMYELAKGEANDRGIKCDINLEDYIDDLSDERLSEHHLSIKSLVSDSTVKNEQANCEFLGALPIEDPGSLEAVDEDDDEWPDHLLRLYTINTLDEIPEYDEKEYYSTLASFGSYSCNVETKAGGQLCLSRNELASILPMPGDGYMLKQKEEEAVDCGNYCRGEFWEYVNTYDFNKNPPSAPGYPVVAGVAFSEELDPLTNLLRGDAVPNAISIDRAINDTNFPIYEGTHDASMQFYYWAHDDMMPVTGLALDWGDGERSAIQDNVQLKNMKPVCQQSEGIKLGYCANDANNTTDKIPGFACADNADCTAWKSDQACYLNDPKDRFGDTPDACFQGYYQAFNTYDCTPETYNYLLSRDGECEEDEFKTPCVVAPDPDDPTDRGYCRYRPRVIIMDNWGWCNKNNQSGEVGLESQDSINDCYQEKDIAGQYFDGYVRVYVQE